MTPTLQAIFLSPTKCVTPYEVDSVEITPHGLAGDRYALGVGTFNKAIEEGDAGRHVTLIEADAVDACFAETGDDFRGGLHRRNLVTQGLTAGAGDSLQKLINQRLRIGRYVVLRVERTCPPCGHLSRLTSSDARRSLANRGGLRLSVLECGLIRTGQAIEILPTR